MKIEFEKTYAYDKYVKNGKDLEKTFVGFEHDIVLDILMIMDFQADIPRTRESVNKFLQMAGKFMPKNGLGFDGGLSLELYAYAHTAENLYYNFCDLMYISEMLNVDDVKKVLDVYAAKSADGIFDEIKDSHFNFSIETVFKVLAVIQMMMDKYKDEPPYVKGDGYDPERRKAFLKDVCDSLECPFFDEIQKVAETAYSQS